MSGPSATANPISAKIAVSSSMTWVIGWTRPISAGASRTGSVTSTLSVLSRAAHGFERGVVAGGGNVGENFVFELRQIGHRSLRQERQIGVRRSAAGLGQHAMDLAAMVGLMVEHVGDQNPTRLGDFAADGAGEIGLFGGEPIRLDTIGPGNHDPVELRALRL